MSPETFTTHVRNYCAWAESNTHDIETVYQLLQSLREGAPGFKTSDKPGPERGLPGLPVEVQWAESKRYVDFPFCAYPVVFWPYEMHPEGPFTEIIYDDFAHIYAELRRGLQIMERGDIANAL